VQMQSNLGIFGAKDANHLRQDVARLRMRGGDRQRTAVGLAQLRRGAPDILHFPQNAAGAGNYLLPRRRGASERAALALKQLKSQLFLEQLELAAHARLRSMQLPRGGGNVQAILVDRHEIAQLLELHRLRKALSLNALLPP